MFLSVSFCECLFARVHIRLNDYSPHGILNAKEKQRKPFYRVQRTIFIACYSIRQTLELRVRQKKALKILAFCKKVKTELKKENKHRIRIRSECIKQKIQIAFITLSPSGIVHFHNKIADDEKLFRNVLPAEQSYNENFDFRTKDDDEEEESTKKRVGKWRTNETKTEKQQRISTSFRVNALHLLNYKY